MTPADIREEIIDILGDITPDEDLSDLKDDEAFRRFPPFLMRYADDGTLQNGGMPIQDIFYIW